MVDLTTSYLGLPLRTPFMPGASPLTDDLGVVRELEDMGAGAIVLRSLFEEQVVKAETGYLLGGDRAYSLAEGLSFMPMPDPSALWPEEYLRLVTAVKEAVSVPVIASLNGVTRSGWIRYAAMAEKAGADALELNVYHALAAPGRSGAEIEDETVGLVRDVKASVGIPVAVKLSPYWSNLADMAARLEAAGANGLVLFNRFYQPDIDLEAFDVVPRIELSRPWELRLPLRWIAILRPQLGPGVALAATSGVHSGTDVVKALMVGADVAMLTSALLQHGAGHLRLVEDELRAWMAAHDRTSVDELRGSATQATAGDPAAFERANYVAALHSWATA